MLVYLTKYKSATTTKVGKSNFSVFLQLVLLEFNSDKKYTEQTFEISKDDMFL